MAADLIFLHDYFEVISLSLHVVSKPLRILAIKQKQYGKNRECADTWICGNMKFIASC